MAETWNTRTCSLDLRGFLSLCYPFFVFVVLRTLASDPSERYLFCQMSMFCYSNVQVFRVFATNAAFPTHPYHIPSYNEQPRPSSRFPNPETLGSRRCWQPPSRNKRKVPNFPRWFLSRVSLNRMFADQQINKPRGQGSPAALIQYSLVTIL